MGTTGSTTRPDSGGRYPALLVISALALALLVLSWPRLHAAWIYLPVESAIQDYWNGRSMPPERLPELEERTRLAIAAHADPRYWEGLSLLKYLEALLPGKTLNEQRLAFEASVTAADESLKLAPVQPRLWMRRADAMDWLSFRAEPALDAFKMSVLTGRVEPTLQRSRLRLGYARLGTMDEEGRHLLADQTQLAWQMRRDDVLNALRRGELKFSRLRYLLAASHPDLLAEIELALSPGG